MLFLIYFKTTLAAEKIVVERYEDWNHPILVVFKKYGISLYKLSYSQDGKYPTFYAKFKYSPDEGTPINNESHKVYSELLKANSYFPYTLVDEKNNVKINVKRSDVTKKTMVVDIGKISSSPVYKSDSHTNVDNDIGFSKFPISERMTKHIFSSPYRTSIRRADGLILDAFLYAENEQMEPEEYIFCNGIKQKIFSKTGNYYIYLYDASTDYFLPYRIEVFKGTKIRMNIGKAGFFTLYMTPKRSDILLVSQSACGGNYYEAYGFSENQLFLKKYIFVAKEKHEQFYGHINKNNKDEKKIDVYGKYENDKMQKMYLSVSDVPGEIQLQPAP